MYQSLNISVHRTSADRGPEMLKPSDFGRSHCMCWEWCTALFRVPFSCCVCAGQCGSVFHIPLS